MRGSRRLRSVAPLGAAALAAAVGLAACNDTLVDHNASEEVLHPSPCPSGEVLCGAACVAEDANHCGPTCASCAGPPPDPNAGPICTEAHACGFACNPGWLRVGTACERAVAISAGWGHTCAITATTRTVKCWGANDHGQLGDGTTQDSAVPVDVALPAAAIGVAAGYVHTCAALAGGDVWCWGDNTTGSLGDGTTTQRTAPVRVALGGIATAVSAGGGENLTTPPTFYGHSCALLANGAISCWGSNESGQLGNGSFVQSTSPVQVALGSAGAATAVSNGDRHTCAIAGGGAWCWGAAASWQLGNGSTTNQARPVQAQLQSGAAPVAVAAGAAHSCAVPTSPAAALWCWGDNSFGQATNDATGGVVQRPAAVALAGVSPIGVAAGSEHTCVVDGPTGAATCFGANDASQLSGTPARIGSVQVPLPRPIHALAAGYAFTCALLDDGGIDCWGANGRGQLGLGTISASVPTPSAPSGR